MTPAQCRAARALVGVATAAEFAKAAVITVTAIAGTGAGRSDAAAG